MFRISTLFVISFSLLTFKVSAQEKKQKTNYEREGYVKAIVVHYEIESCGYFIELADKAKTRLAPHKLPDEFKKDKGKVWVKYTIAKKQLPSTCMVGKQAEVTDIQKRK